MIHPSPAFGICFSHVDEQLARSREHAGGWFHVFVVCHPTGTEVGGGNRVAWGQFDAVCPHLLASLAPRASLLGGRSRYYFPSLLPSLGFQSDNTFGMPWYIQDAEKCGPFELQSQQKMARQRVARTMKAVRESPLAKKAKHERGHAGLADAFFVLGKLWPCPDERCSLCVCSCLGLVDWYFPC